MRLPYNNSEQNIKFKVFTIVWQACQRNRTQSLGQGSQQSLSAEGADKALLQEASASWLDAFSELG